MKIIFISDIHSNSNYLDVVKKYIESEKADKIFFLGDAIGYYDDPNYVLNWLKEIDANCIKGNHEKYFLNELKYNENYEDIYRIKDARKNITEINKEFMCSWKDKLDLVIDEKKFIMVHGDSNSSETYVYGVESIDKDIISQYDYYVHGHTHIPYIKYHKGCCIINPGSIGQPRDYTKQSSYVVMDTVNLEITIKKIDVNVEYYCDYLKKKFYDDKVINILERENNG